MPLRRKICKVGNSRALFLPSGWLDDIERKHGPIEFVNIEVDKILKVAPVLKETSK